MTTARPRGMGVLTRALIAAALLTAGPCPVSAQNPADQGWVPVARPVTNPAGPQARLPHLGRMPGGGLLMSWVEPTPNGHALRAARWAEGRWGPVVEVASGGDWFINWADYPSVAAMSERFWVAHWLVRRAGGKSYDYDIALALSTDAGKTWSRPVTPHRDGVAAEHGFVSLFARGERAGLVWLDGRDYVSPKAAAQHDHGAKSGKFALRYTEIGADGGLSPEQVLDDNTCTCCATAAAVTPAGPVVAYRGRRDGEIRDNFLLRAAASGWTAPSPLGAEGWHMPACPVNGPSLAASGSNLAAVWYTGEGNRPRVRAALSRDAGKTFGAPMDLDAADPVGRVAAAWLDPATAVVAWIAAPDASRRNSPIVLRTMSAEGRLGSAHRVASVDAGRDTGMPQLAADGKTLMLAWTGPGPSFGLRTVVVDASAAPDAGGRAKPPADSAP